MGERKALRWATPANAWAVGLQLISLSIPVLSVFESYQPIALEEIARPLADAWQWVLLITAAIALAATLTMQLALGDGRRMQTTLRVEGLATFIVAICYLLLWVALMIEYGFGTAPLTQLLVAGLGFTAAGRVAQILWELWQYRRALIVGHVATTEAIAQHKET
ncbi:hypothetical protein [Microbacterium sp.]|uniref:hypothetical protein n=1 Tax=Microbacterium sp. TaxID=51671 RepID=UPI003F71378E